MKLHLPKMLLAAVLVCVNSYALTVDTSTSPGSTIVTNENQTWSKTYTNVHVPTNAGDIPGSVVEATIITSGQLGQDSQDYSQIGNAGDIIVGGSGQLILQTWLRGAISMDNDIYLGSTTATQALLLKEFSGSITLNGSLNLVENSIISMEGKTSNPININGATNGSGYTLSAVGIKNTTFAGTVNLGGLSTTSTDDVPTSQFTFANTTTIGTLTLGNATELTFKGYEKTATIGTVTGDASLALTIAEGTTLDIQGGSVKLSSLENNGTLRLNAAITATGVTRQYASANGYVLSKETLTCGNIELGSAASINGVSAIEYSLVDGTYTRTYNQAETGDMYHVVSGTVNIGDVATSVTDTHKGYVVYNQATLDLNCTQSSGQRVELRKGATLANSSTTDISNEAGTNVQQLKELVLEGDATVSATSNLGVCAGSHAQSVLDLGGHKLTKTGGDMFSVVNATISAGSIDIQNGKVRLIDKSNTQGGALSVDSGVAVNIAQGATLEWWSDQTASQVNGAFLKNLTGTGTVKIDHGQGGEVYIEGVASSAGPAHKIDFSGIIEMSSDTTLVLGAKHKGGENYDHAGWALDMSNTTISLNGGGLRFCGNATTIDTVDVNAADTLLYHDSRKSAGDTGLTIKTLNLDAQLSITRKWKGSLNIETLQGAGDLAIKTGSNEVVVNIAATDADYYGTISTQSGSWLNLGTADTTVNLAKTIENAGTVNLAGDINVTSDGNYTLYTLGESSYSADNGVNGFRTTTGSKYYLVKGQGTTTLDGTVLWDGVEVETSEITTGDDKGLLFTAGTFTDESAYYVNTTVSSDVQNTAKYVLNAEGAELTIASGSLSNSRIQYNAGAVNVNGNTLLLDTASEDINAILSTATGSGRIIISQNALYAGSTGGAAAAKPAFTGTWEVTSGTLSIGDNRIDPKQLGWLVDLSGLTAIELNGGNLFYNGAASKLGNISVLKDATLRMHDMPATDPCPVLNIGSLSIAQDKTLTLEVNWKGSLNIEVLTGAGTLKNSDGGAAGGVTFNDGTRLLTVGIGSGFTGKLDLQKGDNTIVIGNGITLNSSQVVNNAQDKTALKTAAIKGTGTYNLGSSTSLGVVSLNSEWKGTVKMSGATLSDTNLNDYGNANSTVQLYNANGSLAAGTVDTKLSLQGDNYNPAIKINTTTGKTVTFANTVSSTGNNGNFVVEATDEGKNTGTDTYVFSGDVSGWTGNFIAASDTNVKYEGNATTISNSICANAGTLNATIGGDKATTVNGAVTNKKWDTSNGTLNLKVTNSSAEGATFTNTVKVNTTTIAAGSKATFNGSSDLGSLTLESGAFIEGAGSLTIGELVLNLESYTQNYEKTHTLVTTTGSLTFNGNLVGYTDVKMNNGYIANVTNTGSSLLLTFTQPDQSDTLTTTVLDATLNGTLLTLNVDGDITVDTRFVNITGFADGVLADILNLTKGVEDGMVGIKLVDKDQEYPIVGNGVNNVGFYGAYYGAGNGQYFVQYIPEPATATLSLLALAGLAARRRRK